MSQPQPHGMPEGGVEGGEPCPRCASRDTRFKRYHHGNTSKPQHFCKGCRRCWTKSGTLRENPARKKRLVEAPAAVADVSAVTHTVAAADSAKTTTTTTDGASEMATETALAAAPAALVAEEGSDSLAHLLLLPEVKDADTLAQTLLQPGPGAEDAVMLGLRLSYFSAGNALLDDDSFTWPEAFDLGACWANVGLADPEDPANLFLNLP